MCFCTTEESEIQLYNTILVFFIANKGIYLKHFTCNYRYNIVLQSKCYIHSIYVNYQ